LGISFNELKISSHFSRSPTFFIFKGLMIFGVCPHFYSSKILIQSRTQAKTVLCRYHALPGGCSRGDACLYAHGEQELRSNIVHEKVKLTSV
jgi:hypothetical protein